MNTIIIIIIVIIIIISSSSSRGSSRSSSSGLFMFIVILINIITILNKHGGGSNCLSLRVLFYVIVVVLVLGDLKSGLRKWWFSNGSKIHTSTYVRENLARTLLGGSKRAWCKAGPYIKGELRGSQGKGFEHRST